MNIGRLQILYWPRRRLYFRRGHYARVYAWILYLWPVELRYFDEP